MCVCRFLTKSNGVLFEDEVLQIGIKSDYKKNLGEPPLSPHSHPHTLTGRIGVFFGNKSTNTLTHVTIAVTEAPPSDSILATPQHTPY